MDSIAETAAAIASGDRSAETLIDALLAEIADDDLNAFTAADPYAVERAAAIDEAVAAGEAVGPLAGVPIAVKDLIDHRGRVNSRGSSIATEPATTTAECVRRLEAAGAIVVGRTGLHEYAFGFSSENHWFGPVHNPWDATLSPGGSSGGSGAAVAAGLAAGALGTDTGGSVRVPAALCGVVGLKVTHGRIPIGGVYPLASSIDTVGPLARTVDDTALLYAILAGHDPSDPWSLPEPVAPPQTVELADLRVGVVTPWTDGPNTDDVDAAWHETLDRLRSHGVRVVEIELPELETTGRMLASFGHEVAALHRRRFTERPETYGPEVAERIAAAMTVTDADYHLALAWRRRLRHQFEVALSVCDVLATPTVAALCKTIGVDEIVTSAGAEHYRLPLSRYTAAVNHALLPAIALPLDMEGAPPPSLQLIGPAWSESLLLGIGAALEAVGLVGWRTPPTR